MTTTSGVLKDTRICITHVSLVRTVRRAPTPRNLVAAAHASCFTMKSEPVLNAAGFTAENLECTANVKMDKVGDGMVWSIHFDLKGRYPASARAVPELRGKCEGELPISQLLKSVPITLSAALA
ncbi:MAG: OsmC family protein [Flavobacteriales bacterium]|nr:OsmC family protein [Flavobacteriales bacterium]